MTGAGLTGPAPTSTSPYIYMMRVQITTHMAGLGFLRRPGDIMEVPDAEAASMIAAGYAEPLPEPEQATIAGDRTATTRPPKRRRRRKKTE